MNVGLSGTATVCCDLSFSVQIGVQVSQMSPECVLDDQG